jgi:iron complex outermembrane recepter protein
MMMPSTRQIGLRGVVTLGALLGCIYPTWVLAQASPAEAVSKPDSAALEEIVVTAEHKSENIQDVPISVTAIMAQDLYKFDLPRIEDIALMTPSLTFNTGYGYAQQYIRGVGSSNVNNGLENAVSTYVDGAYQERSIAALNDLFDLDGIQVLKGPQGTLYGRNATGGAILVNTADPTHTESVSVAAEGGTEDHYLGEIVANLPISDTLALRIGVHAEGDGGYVRNLYDGNELGGRQSETERAKLLWTPTDNFTAKLGVEYNNTIDQNVNYSRIYPNNLINSVYQTDQNDDGPHASHYFNTNLNLLYDLGALSFQSITNYNSDNIKVISDVDASPLNIEAFNLNTGGQTITEDLQVSTNFPGWINGIAGVDYLHDRGIFNTILSGSLFPSAYFVDGQFPAGDNVVITESTSAFAEAYLTPIDQLKITIGGRGTYDWRSLSGIDNGSGVNILSGGALTQSGPSFYQSVHSDSFTPRFVVAYDIGSTNLYASYNKGYKAGGFAGPAFAPENVVAPETIKSYELGAKFVSSDHRLRLNGDAFYYDYNDIAVETNNPATGGQQEVNAGAARGYGVEFDGSWAVNEVFKLLGGADYLNARYTNFAKPAVFVPSGSAVVGQAGPCAAYVCESSVPTAAGTPLTRSPDFTAFLGTNIKTSIGNDWQANLNIIAKYSDKYYFNVLAGGPLGLDQQPAITIVNMTGSIGPNNDRYTIGFYINNLLNTKYYNYIDTAAPAGTFAQAARPITGGVRLTAKF